MESNQIHLFADCFPYLLIWSVNFCRKILLRLIHLKRMVFFCFVSKEINLKKTKTKKIYKRNFNKQELIKRKNNCFYQLLSSFSNAKQTRSSTDSHINVLACKREKENAFHTVKKWPGSSVQKDTGKCICEKSERKRPKWLRVKKHEALNPWKMSSFFFVWSMKHWTHSYTSNRIRFGHSFLNWLANESFYHGCFRLKIVFAAYAFHQMVFLFHRQEKERNIAIIRSGEWSKSSMLQWRKRFKSALQHDSYGLWLCIITTSRLSSFNLG